MKTHFSDTSVLDNHDPEEEKVAAIFAALELEKQIQPATSLNNETVASNWKKNRITLN